MFVIKKCGMYLCQKGAHHSQMYLSFDLQEARVFKNRGACKNSRAHIQEYTPEYKAWLEIPWEKKIGIRRPKAYDGTLKEYYEIKKIYLTEK